MKADKRLLPILVMVVTFLVYGFVIFFRTRYLHRNNLPVYWLEELWAPTGFLSLVVVISAERLFSHEKKAKPKKKKSK